EVYESISSLADTLQNFNHHPCLTIAKSNSKAIKDTIFKVEILIWLLKEILFKVKHWFWPSHQNVSSVYVLRRRLTVYH
ncbi:hypothetical protein L9F63_019353, partial [Diploptera punctata]